MPAQVLAMRPPPLALQPHDRVRAVLEHSTGLPAVPALPGMFTPHPSHASSLRPDEKATADAGIAARTLLMPLEPQPTAALNSADDEDMEGVAHV